MAHVKVWLGVVLTLVLAALLWLIPPKLHRQVQLQQPRLTPLVQNDAVQQQLSSFFKKHVKTLRQLATHKGLRNALTELAAKKPDRRGKRHKKAHKALTTDFPFFRGAQQSKRVYIFSYAGKLIFRTDAPNKYEQDERLFSSMPFVSSVRNSKNKPSYGFWRLGSQPFFFGAVPIKQGTDLLGVLMMSMKVDRELFIEMGIHPDTRKTHPLILIDTDKPLASAIPKDIQSATKAWLNQHYHKLSKQLQAGLFVASKSFPLKGNGYSYIVSRVPVPVTDSAIGYVLLAKMPQTKPALGDIYRGPLPGWLAMGAGGFAFLLALWFSLGLAGYRRKLRRAVELCADAPSQLQHADAIPSKGLQAPMRTLMNKVTQAEQAARQAAAAPAPKAAVTAQKVVRPAPAPTPAPEPVPAGAVPAPFGTRPAEKPSAVKLPPSLMDPAYADKETAAEAPADSFQASAPPVAAQETPPPASAPVAIEPKESLPDLSSELEDAFSNIQEDELPLPILDSAGANTPAPANRSTLMYEQFDDKQLAAATKQVRDQQLQKIFKDYIDMRQKCGESTQNIKFEQFVERLDKQRAAIIQQYSCDDVQFHIYEKAGKAAIKATPIK